MALPADWIDRIFQRMAVMYGARFADLWAGVDEASLKATWAEALDGMTAEQIRGGLQACMERQTYVPPSLPEFRQLCRRAPAPIVPMLPHRPMKDAATEAERQKCLALIDKLNSTTPRGLQWAERLRDSHAAGERLSVIQIALYQAALQRKRQASAQTDSEAVRGMTQEYPV